MDADEADALAEADLVAEEPQRGGGGEGEEKCRDQQKAGDAQSWRFRFP
jgi:hypothetical protein